MKRSRARKGAPGIVDVANRAGVSPATVSRFYNNPEVVRGSTRKRIEEAAEDLGYIRDRLAGTLHNHISGTVGLVVPTIDNAIFAQLIEAFSAHLQACDRTMLIAAHGYDLALETGIIRSLLERRIDGIALVGFDHDHVPMNMLAQRDVPVVSTWNYREDASIPCVGANNRQAGTMIARHLVDLGHRDIALLFPDTIGNDRARDRFDGFFEVLRDEGLSEDWLRVYHCPYDLGAAKQLALKLLEESPPTAVACCNDVIAHGVLYAAQALNIEVPKHLSVVGIGDFRGSEHMEPALTTVRLPARRIGALAAEIILHMSETGQPPQPMAQSIDLTFVKRASTGVPCR